jgi:hypothetical protein
MGQTIYIIYISVPPTIACNRKTATPFDILSKFIYIVVHFSIHRFFVLVLLYLNSIAFVLIKSLLWRLIFVLRLVESLALITTPEESYLLALALLVGSSLQSVDEERVSPSSLSCSLE